MLTIMQLIHYSLKQRVQCALCCSLSSALGHVALPLVMLCWLLSSAVEVGAQVNTNRMMQVGRNALYFEDYVLSIQYFNRVIIVKPYLSEPYYYRAIAKYYLDDLRGCASDCDVALEINPFLVDAYNLRGIAHLRLDKPDLAKQDFEKGLELEPENPNMLMNAGVACINLKEFDHAIGLYDKLLQRDSRNVQAMLYRGVALVERGDTTLALTQFEKAVAVNAYSVNAITYLAMMQYQLKLYSQALDNYNKLAELRPQDPFVFINRAITRYNLDDLRGCMSDLDQALRLDPKSKMAYQNRGILRAESGDLNNAADDFSHALALDPSDDITLFNRANVYLQLGEAANALQDFNIIIAKHPDFGPAYQQRAVAKRQLGDNKGAEIDYLTAMNFEQEKVKRGLKNAQDAQDAQPDKDGNKKESSANEPKRSSRSKNDNDMRKYDQMVVVADFGDNDDKLSQGTPETIRGRVQDRDIVIDLEPPFALTFFAADTLLPNAPYFSPSAQSFNASRMVDEKLVVANREVTDREASARVFGMIANVNQNLDADPHNGQLYLLRGTLQAMVMNYTSAITDLSACLIQSPTDVNALFNRAAARYKMVETMRDLDAETNPQLDGDLMSNSTPMPNLKKEVTVLDYDLILKDLDRVLELEPDNEFAYFNKSLVYCQRKDMDMAVEMLTQSLKLNPQLAEAYFNRGVIRIYLGHEDEGVQDLSRAGELGMFKAYNVIKRYANNE